MADTVEKNVVVKLKTGLHARPAARFVQEANKYAADIFIQKGEKKVNAKSIMGVMMLAAECGSSLVIRADGGDEAAAVDAIAALVGRGFDEA